MSKYKEFKDDVIEFAETMSEAGNSKIDKPSSAINWEKIRADDLSRKGYSKEDIGLLEFLKEDCLNKDIMKIYLERYIHIKTMCESGNKQLCDEIKLLVKDKVQYLKLFASIKESYDSDFTESELSDLCPREEYIYDAVSKILE